MSKRNHRILLGHIAAAHGIRGDLLVKTYTQDPAAITSYGKLTDETGKTTFDIKVVRETTKGIVARIKGVTDRNAAEALRGTKLFCDRSQLPEIEDEDTFYFNDLVGLTAVSTEGDTIGEVVAVENFGASDLLEIKQPGQTKTELVPFTHAFVPEVDIQAGTVTILWPLQTTPGEPERED